MDKLTIRYLKWEYSRGKSVAAQWIDVVGLRMALFFGAYLAFLMLTHRFTASLALAALATVAVSLVLHGLEQNRFSRFCEAYIRRMRNDILLERLCILDKYKRLKFFARVVENRFAPKYIHMTDTGVLFDGKYAHCFANHPSGDVTAQQIVEAYHTARGLFADECYCLSASGYSAEAKELAASLKNFKLCLIGAEEILENADSEDFPSEAQVLRLIASRVKERRLTLKKLKKEALAATKIRVYVACGATLLVLGLVMRMNFYLIIVAGLCLALAVASYLSDVRARKV